MSQNLFWKIIWRLSVVSLFVVSLLIALFYANGYSYDFVSLGLRKTGGIDFRFKDNQARVFLDGTKLLAGLPFVANNLLPGKYQVVVAKDGFQSWQSEVEVRADLVTKINEIVLYPSMDTLAQRNKVLWSSEAQKEVYFMEQGYLFKAHDKTLSYQKLSPDLTSVSWKSLEMPFSGLLTIKAEKENGKYLLGFDDGKRYWLDVGEGTFEPLVLSANYRFFGDQWVCFKGPLIAFFDSNLKRVLAAGKFMDQEINDLSFQEINGKKFIKVNFVGEKDWNLFEYRDGDWTYIDSGLIAGEIFAGIDGAFLVEKSGGELWEISVHSGQWKEVFLKRFEENWKIKDFSLLTRSFIVSMSDELYLADFDFRNIFTMFEGQKIVDFWLDNDALYYLRKATVQGGGVSVSLNYFVLGDK